MTLRHIVSWKFAGETPAERAKLADEAVAKIAPLATAVPTVQALSLHRNELHPETNYDLTLIADFQDADGLAVYATHPAHLPVVEWMKTATTARAASDFTI